MRSDIAKWGAVIANAHIPKHDEAGLVRFAEKA